MLFSSGEFIYLFLPVSLLGYQLLGRFGRNALLSWFAMLSFFFYGYWNPVYLLLLVGSILLNFAFSIMVTRPESSDTARGRWMQVAIVVNILVLVWFKYLFPTLSFFTKHGVGHHHFVDVTLPLGISFFTFTQIAYLIDVRQGIAVRQGLLPYSVFVAFFPHLIAGPLIHPREIMPQLEEGRLGRLRVDDVMLGLSWFILGLAKKVLIADRVRTAADMLYAHPSDFGLMGSWVGVLCYAVQLYFDFSGYSDMAVGLARMFSIEFPTNFDSPYKSPSVIEFWTRWHMTLSRYIADYLYTPIIRSVSRSRRRLDKRINRAAQVTLGGFVQIVAYPLLTSMFLAGVWHGANVTFLIFGLLHGTYLVINHGWRLLTPEGHPLHNKLPVPIAVSITFAAVLLGQVFFRAENVHQARYVVGSLIGRHGWSTSLGGLPLKSSSTLLLSVPIIWLMPNVQEILGRPTREPQHTPWYARFQWGPTVAWSVGLMVVLCLAIIEIDPGAGFLYFQF